ncbi:lysozyme inhibitor LprI family protein [Enterobacteriaceae bacterium H11S18]|uniref:lysozyme inhibitor LprI family protein n=1 Tax=Enterobacteriaceae TaxID=543 RepID=UPI0019281AED|nr:MULTISPECIES: lysozyme inhibitor LprI family protein [Enterobacteriaceae]MCT4712744.1 lysozyme inhibitor LprI family protein [Dryocola clanedunensis]
MKRVSLLIAGLLLSANVLADSCDNETSQAGLNECYGKEYKKQDDLLNQTYGQAMKLGTDAQKAQLKSAQKAWIAFRDADCAFLSSGADGGSVAPMVHAQCMTDKTVERTELLKSTLHCDEGDVSCVFPPR